MLPIAIGGVVIGYLLGIILKMLIFSKTNGATDGASMLTAVLSLPVVALGLAIFLDGEYNIPVALSGPRVGSAALFFVGGLYYGMRRRAKQILISVEPQPQKLVD